MSTIDLRRIISIATNIDGMMYPESMAIWHAVLEAQHATWAWEGLGSAPYLEIGTFKGKSASVLAHHARAYGNSVVVVDPVVDEETKQLLRSITADIEFFAIRSEYLRTSQLHTRLFRSCAFIHIDGMHTFSAVSDDLRSAEDMISDFGVVCLDDFHTDLYPQIPAALYRHLYTYPSDLSIFLVGFNKAYLCRNAAKRYFHGCVREHFMQKITETGYDVTLIKTDRHDLFDAFALGYADPAVAGDPNR